jgi:hypothetical protein
MMVSILFVSLLLLLAEFSPAAVLIVHADAACQLTVDGRARGTLKPDKPLRLKLTPGPHDIEAVPSVGGTKWLQRIALAATKSAQQLTITMKADHDYWVDSDTNLMWTAADNGSGLSWHQALRYCTDLSLAGFTNWTLPGIEDLQGLFNASPSNNSGFHIKGPLKLTGWQWSSTPGQQTGEGWALDFGDGGRASVAAGDSGLNRALCVRRIQK